jgi:N-acetylmuramoyl-L-alanine amidase
MRSEGAAQSSSHCLLPYRSMERFFSVGRSASQGRMPGKTGVKISSAVTVRTWATARRCRAVLLVALTLGARSGVLAAQDAEPTIVIDPGHPSEVSSGAEIQHGTSEVRIAWQVSLRLARLLRANGYRVVMTKPRERTVVTNIARAEVGNAARAALVVRLHCDAGSDSGYAIYHPDRQGTAHGRTGPSEDVMRTSGEAAESLHVSMARMLAGKLKDGGVRGDTKSLIGGRQGALTGSIFSEVPVVLVEMVTLSNANDATFIKSAKGQSLMAQAIANGIGRYAPASNSPRVR